MKPTAFRSKLIKGLFCLSLVTTTGFVQAGADKFTAGPAIADFGQIAKVETTQPIPKGMKFNVVFDMSQPSDVGKVNRQLDSLARFINMHIAQGVKASDISLAMVVHGRAVDDLANDAYYSKNHQAQPNANKALVKALSDYGVKFYVCGQSATYYGLSKDSLLPGVDMALSAMTAHAILAQQGYSQNPF